MGKVKD